MIGPIDGRWLIDCGSDGPADNPANQIVLGGGVVALASDGPPVGTMGAKRRVISVTMPTPAAAGEEACQITARFALPGNFGRNIDLIGTLHGIMPGRNRVYHPCWLRRRLAQA